MRTIRVLALAGCAVAWANAGLAQQAIDMASVSGRVTDATGAVIPDAHVTARQTETNVTMATLTDGEGRFRFAYLRIGPHEILVRRDGFREAARSLTLTAGSAFELPVVLTIAVSSANVTVTADDTVLEAARTQIAQTISGIEMKSLPLNGRNFLDTALLVPGVSPANIPNAQLFQETSAVPGVSLSIASQRNLSNNFIVDGLSANDDAAALSGITYSVDAIEQFQVVTSGGQAELGRALGGYVSVVTKNGTNSLRGTAYDYLRDDRLNGRNALIGARLPMSQSQYGASVGGPIVRDRAFYFGSFERRDAGQSGLTTITPGDVSAINARLAAAGYHGPPVSTGPYDIPLVSTNGLTKGDVQLGNRDRLGLRYSLYDLTSKRSRNAGGLAAPSVSTHLDTLDHSMALSNTFIMSSRTVLETRAQAASSELTAPPADPIGPAVSIAGVASFGTSSGNPSRRVNTMAQVVNNVSHQAGSHALRFGLDLLHNRDRITFPRAIRGSYTFSSLGSFMAGVYNNAGFTQTFGESDALQTNPNVSIYAQDEWKITPAVTINAGIRYDLQFLETVRTDANNISPRAGIAWSPFRARRTIVRGNAGLFYDRVPLRAVANALLSAGNTTDVSRLRQISVVLSPSQAGAPVFPNILPRVVPAVTLPNLTTIDRRLQNAYSRQASVEIEQQAGSRATVTVGYHYVRGLRLLMSINQNVPACVGSSTNNGCRPEPRYANNNRYSAAGESTYHGLHVSMSRRPSRWAHCRVSYTLSKAMNNVGEFFFSSPIDPFELARDWGRSDNDRRHQLVAHGAIQTATAPAATLWERISHGFQLSGILQAYSSLPMNITSGVTTVQGTPGRPVVNGRFLPRNAGTGSDFLTVNARLSRSFALGRRASLELIAEAFNLTNRRNVLARDSNFGSGVYPQNPAPGFGRITAVGEPRAGQLAARVRF